MALNLSRNTRAWFTTNVNSTTGVLTDANSGFTTSNTFELQILDGFSFSQGTNAATITLSEGGNTPTRGQRAFNTALNPVDFSFSTYVRPNKTTANGTTCIERCLWNALVSADAIDQPLDSSATAAGSGLTSTMTRGSTTAATFTGLQGTFTTLPVAGEIYNLVGSGTSSWDLPFIATTVAGTAASATIAGEFLKAPPVAGSTTSTIAASARLYKGAFANGTSSTATPAYLSTMNSQKNQLQKFALVFLVDNVYYCIDNCVMNQATIDFGLDAISTIAWSGNGATLKQLSTVTAGVATLGGSTVTQYVNTAGYITNKLSTVTLQQYIGGGGTNYVVPITGGSITINNNATYLTPSNLGVVNQPITYFTGTRSISGSLNAYLRTGTSTETGGLLTALLTSGSETKYKLQVEVGGSSNANRIELEMPGVTLQVPTVDVADVVSTTINFNAQAFDPVTTSTSGYDITKSNELLVRYYSINTQ